MLIKEYLENQTLFSAINDIETITCFNGLDVTIIDKMFIAKYANSTCNSMCDYMSISEWAQFFAKQLVPRWNKLYEIKSLEYNPLEYSSNNTETREKTYGDETREDYHNVSAYNEENYSNDTQDKSTTSRKNDTEVVTKTSKHNYENGFNSQLKYFNWLTKTLIFDIMFLDVKEMITLSIYETEEN